MASRPTSYSSAPTKTPRGRGGGPPKASDSRGGAPPKASSGRGSARTKASGGRGARGAALGASERALVEAGERRLTRLGFDLHDGPIQEVVVLAQDLRLLASQLDGLLGPRAQRELVRGRIEDLDAQLVALEASLRRLSNEVRAPVLPDRPLAGALRHAAGAFAARTGIEPRLVLDGDSRPLSASQRIALLNIVAEALTNIREHSDATEVEIVVSVDAGGVEARIADNGCGFEVEATTIRAAREGRVGLAAMRERVRLLGGRCAIESRPGGPTVVSVALERYVGPCADGAKPFTEPESTETGLSIKNEVPTHPSSQGTSTEHP